MKEKITDVVVLFCAPFSLHPEQPTDQSKSELVDCATCKEKMWLSKKKKHMANLAYGLGKEILMECYICFKKRVKEDPSIMLDSLRIDL